MLLIHYENKDLKFVLNDLEKKYNVKFSYLSDLIIGKKISLKENKRNLDDVLFEITYLINIQFNKLDGKYIYLSKTNTQNLNEVIVNSYLTDGISKNKNTSFQIIPKKLGLLAGLTETDILESIQQLPGVVSIDETATGLTVRGGTADQNRIIWDDINIYQSGHLFGLVSVFNPNVANNITFYNKGTNAKFGERISSVIDIQTNNEIRNKTSLEMGFNGIDVDAILKVPIIKDKFNLQTSLRRSYEDIIETNTFKKFEQKAFQNTRVDEEFFFFTDYNLKLNYVLNKKNDFHFSLIHIENELKNDFTNRITNIANFDKLETENTGYSLHWNYKWNEKVIQKTNINSSNYKLNYSLLTKQQSNFISEFSKENTISEIGLSTEIEYKINKNKSITLGYQNLLKQVAFLFKEQEDILYILDNDDSTIDTHAFFSSYTYKNNNLFDLYSGLRINYYSSLNKFRFEPRITLNKKLNNNLKLLVTGEIKNQIISQIDETVLSDLSLERKLWRLANNEKHPIINSSHVSSGLVYTKNSWTFDFDLFYKNVTGISTLPLGFLNENDNTFHVGKQKIYGLDFYLKKDFNKLKTWVSYSFIDAKNKYNGLNNNKYFTSNTDIKHLVTTSVSYKIKNLQFAMSWKFRSGKPLTDLDIDENENEFFEGINTERLPYYHRLDFSSTYRFLFSKNGSTKGKIGFSLRNIYNNKNHISTEFFGNNTIDDPIRVIENHSIGITPNILFRVYW